MVFPSRPNARGASAGCAEHNKTSSMQRLFLAVASSHKQRLRTMKTLSTISAAAVLATTFAIPAWAAPVGMARTAPAAQANTAQTQVNPELIATLQKASEEAARAGTYSCLKNNPAHP